MQIVTSGKAKERSKVMTEGDKGKINAGDTVCGNCRILLLSDSQNVTSLDNEDIDVSYVVDLSKQRETVSTEEYVDLPVPRIVDTYKYCFICGVVNNIVSAALVQCYSEKQLYIPRGNHCCQKHLIKNSFFYSRY